MFKKTAIFLMLIFSLLSAVPANPEPFTVETENGSRLTLQLKGDENISWYESSDGFTVLQTKNKQFVYATKDTSGKLLPSDVEAADPVFRTDNEKLFLNGIEKKLFFSEDQLKTKR